MALYGGMVTKKQGEKFRISLPIFSQWSMDGWRDVGVGDVMIHHNNKPFEKY